jgi:hypothetical protein
MKLIELQPIEAISQRSTASNGNMPNIFARWQSGLETLAGYGVWKLRLEVPPSRPQAISKLESIGALR